MGQNISTLIFVGFVSSSFEMGVDQIEWWAGRWEAGQSGWHSAAPQPPLVAHLPTLSGGSETPSRVLVPLCGKAGCLNHLLKAGHDVVGIEGVESVVEEFFSENGLTAIRTDIPGVKGGKYSTPDNRITIFACNLFDVTPEMVGKVDAVWDRGSFVALSCDTRPRYAALLKRIVGDSFRYLLQAWEYDTNKYPGPPHSVSVLEMETFFGPWAEISVLKEDVMGPEHEQSQRFKVDKMTERIFLMVPKIL